jgi:hypothetical protein
MANATQLIVEALFKGDEAERITPRQLDAPFDLPSSPLLAHTGELGGLDLGVLKKSIMMFLRLISFHAKNPPMVDSRAKCNALIK